MPFESEMVRYYNEVITPSHVMVTDHESIQELLPEALKGVRLYKTVFVLKDKDGNVKEIWGSENAVVYSLSFVTRIR